MGYNPIESFDFAAFDIVSHDIRLQKLSKLSVDRPVLKWFCPYLDRRL